MINDVSVFTQHRFANHWQETKLRSIFTYVDDLTEQKLPLLGANLVVGVTERYEGDGRPAASEDLSKYKLVEIDDIIMNPLGKPHGSIGRSYLRGITSPAYWILRCDPSLHSAGYFHHVLRSPLLISEFQRRSKNLPPNQFGLPWEQFRDIQLPIPPLAEQVSIARYLDDQIVVVEKMISAIPKFKELKGSLLTYSITGEFRIGEYLRGSNG